MWQNTLRFVDEPRLPPTEYFIVQLLDSDNIVIGQTVINHWGYSPLSIYVDNTTASTFMPWKSDNCALLMTGSSLYGTPTGFTPYRYEIEDMDWRGVCGSIYGNSLVDDWLKSTAIWLEEKNGVDPGTYRTTGTSGQWCMNPNELAQSLFLEGIPYIDHVRSKRFITSSINPPGEDIDDSYASGIYSAVWGTYWSAAFLNLASPWGLVGQWVVGAMWGMLVIGIGAVVRKSTGDPNVTLVVMFVVGVIGCMFGSFAMVIALIATIVSLLLLLHNFLLQRT